MIHEPGSGDHKVPAPFQGRMAGNSLVADLPGGTRTIHPSTIDSVHINFLTHKVRLDCPAAGGTIEVRHDLLVRDWLSRLIRRAR